MELDFNSLLAMAFGMWAGVVAWLGHGIRSDLRQIATDLRAESKKLSEYIVQTESRLAVLEREILRIMER